ncbi:MAG: hypothetical protein HY958_07430 [Bacteroidia bacterium]|nr:hypothetical protein [Bacteroidia bacterium]
MDKKKCFYFGMILKPHGVFGALVLKIEINFLDYLIDKLESIFIEIDGQLVPFFISEINCVGKETAIVKLDEVDDEKQVKKLIGCRLYLLNKFLPAACLSGLPAGRQGIPEGAEISTDLSYARGFLIIDSSSGNIGFIHDILHFSFNSVFQVFKDGKEILIPATGDIIRSVDIDNKIIRITAPEGLIDLYEG